MPQLIANIGSRQALIDDVLVGSKVRYLSNFSVAPHFSERPESAQPGRPDACRRRTGFHPLLPISQRYRMDRRRPIVLKNSTMDADGCGGTERLSG